MRPFSFGNRAKKKGTLTENPDLGENLRSLRSLLKSACSEKIGHFDEISFLSEPAYAGRLIGGERKTKDRKMDIFNENDHLSNDLLHGDRSSVG